MSDGMSEMAREEASARQVAGSHYKKYAIQPAEYCAKNKIGFLPGTAIKYVTRYKDKGGAEDIRKAIHILELILEFEYPALLSNNNECQAKPGALGAAIGGIPATQLPPITSGSHRDEGELLYATPKLILKLESDDPDTIGELYGSVRAHQERGNASGSGEETRRTDYSTGYQERGSEGTIGGKTC